MTSITDLRRTLRQARRALSCSEQRQHALSLARLISREFRVLRARRIGGYWPSDGELDINPLLRRWTNETRVYYLPILRKTPGPGLWFAPLRPGQSICPNRFGIPEPCSRGRALKRPGQLDVLLTPLVGFDADCNRIGMGGGFYDRALAYLHRRQHWRRPYLIGIAHECQRVAHIAARPWDVPLDAVFTERRGYFRTRSSENAVDIA